MKVERLIGSLIAQGFGPFTGIPCSTLAPMLSFIEDHSVDHYNCSSEGEAMGIAAGVAMGSKKIPVVYMQSDGFANALNPLTSLNIPYKIPALLIISWRGRENEPQHNEMGKIFQKILSLLGIEYEAAESYSDIGGILSRAKCSIESRQLPYAIIVKRDTFETYESATKRENPDLPSRAEYLLALKGILKPDDLIVSSTGIGGREAYNILKDYNHFYMAGSMGYASSIGLGLAITNPDKRVIVLDGDGALLMNLGSLNTIGSISPRNLIHICFKNGAYESTGGQAFEEPSFSDNSGYSSVYYVFSIKHMNTTFRKLEFDNGPYFINVYINFSKSEYTARPEEPLSEIARRFKENI